MAAIFPTGSSREPIAFLERALRRQLWLKNCLCHVRHIFLAFPLFSSPWLQESRDSRVSLPLRFLSIAPSRSLRIVTISAASSSSVVSHLLFSLFALLPPHCIFRFFLSSSSPFAASFLFFHLSPLPLSYFFFFFFFLTFFSFPLPLRISIAQRGIIVFIPEVSSIERQVADLNNASRNVSRGPRIRAKRNRASVPSM